MLKLDKFKDKFKLGSFVAGVVTALACAQMFVFEGNTRNETERTMNDRMIVEAKKCAEASMMPVTEQATSFWGVNDPFIIVCKPAQFDTLERLTLQLILENRAKDEAKKRSTVKPVNPDSFETKSKVTQ